MCIRDRPYYAPYRGYSYRRLSIGFYMSSMFYGSSYWLDDPWMCMGTRVTGVGSDPGFCGR